MSELTDERLRQLREQPHGRDSVTVLALLDEIERLRDAERERDILKRAFRWFRKYPEFKPNPERMEEWDADILAACALYEEKQG